MRRNKGHGIEKFIDDYCVIDLETTGVSIRNANIVEISAIKVRNDIVVDEFATLVNPECHIPEEATNINHINDAMVENAPRFSDIVDAFTLFVSDDVVIGYNIAGYDLNILYDKLMQERNVPFKNNYIDVMHAARRSISGINDYKLETVSTYYNLDITGKHRALKDCYLTKDCYEKIGNQFGDFAFHKRSDSSSDHKTHYSVETKALQTLQTYLESIISDGRVTEEEFYDLCFWMGEHVDLLGHYPFDRVYEAIDNVLEDGIVKPEELRELQRLFTEFVDPVKSQSCNEVIDSLEGKHIVLTGDFEFGTRAEVSALIEKAGGINDKNITKKTSYLVVGSYGSEAWKAGNYGAKIQKAMEYNKNKGLDIKIIKEKNFIPAMHKLEKVSTE